MDFSVVVIAVLGSSVLTAIVTSLATALQNRKGAKLEYITRERSKWREEIRNIAVELEECKSRKRRELPKVLTKLKVRININGRKPDAKDRDDKYLWERIDKIEGIYGRIGDQSSIDWDRLEEEIEGLIINLGRLLKDDWERSKKEVERLIKVKK